MISKIGELSFSIRSLYKHEDIIPKPLYIKIRETTPLLIACAPHLIVKRRHAYGHILRDGAAQSSLARREDVWWERVRVVAVARKWLQPGEDRGRVPQCKWPFSLPWRWRVL